MRQVYVWYLLSPDCFVACGSSQWQVSGQFDGRSTFFYNPNVLPRPFPLWYGLVSALTATGLALAYMVESPRSWFFLGLTLAIIAGGTHFLVQAHPFYRFYRRRPASVFAWTPPLLLAFAGIAFTKQLLGGPLALLGAAVTVVGVVLLMGCQYLLASATSPFAPLARLATNLLLYLAAFLVFVALQTSILGLNALSLLLGSFSGLTALELFREPAEQLKREPLYALVVGVIIAELSWGLYYVSLGKVYSALALLIAFYLMVGLIHNYLADRLNRWVALEFVGVGVVALVFLYSFRKLGG